MTSPRGHTCSTSRHGVQLYSVRVDSVQVYSVRVDSVQVYRCTGVQYTGVQCTCSVHARARHGRAAQDRGGDAGPGLAEPRHIPRLRVQHLSDDDNHDDDNDGDDIIMMMMRYDNFTRTPGWLNILCRGES